MEETQKATVPAPAACEQMARDQAAAIAQRRSRTISGESLIRDINAALARGDRAIEQLAAIQTELAMIRNDMAELHGLPKG